MDTPDVGERRRAGRGFGVVLIVGGIAGVVVFGLAAALAANPCGAFGDACDDVGGTGDGFGWLLGLVVACLVVAVVGIAIIESSRSDP